MCDWVQGAGNMVFPGNILGMVDNAMVGVDEFKLTHRHTHHHHLEHRSYIKGKQIA